jgi:chromatin remodeling complex protein RSC6
MVRTTKAETKTQAPVANVVVEQTAAPKKSKKVAAAAEPVAAAVTAAPVATEPVVESSENSLLVKMTEYGAKIQQLTTLISTLKSDYKTLEKSVARELKNAQKSSSRKRKTGNRAPSGFVKPTRISDELAQFLGKTVGTEMARTAVSKEINQYIHANKLQDEKNGRIIHADPKLTALLKLNTGDELTYFNLQRYMKHHFVKAVPVASA